MNVTFAWLDSLNQTWDSAKNYLKQDLQKLQSTINTVWDVQHDIDGSHKDITCDSLVLNGSPTGTIQEIAYTPGRFHTGDSAVWTVEAADQVYIRYSVVGQVAFVWFTIQTSTITVDTAEQLLISLPELRPYLGPSTETSQVNYGSGYGFWQDNQHSTAGPLVCQAIAQYLSGSSTIPDSVSLELDYLITDAFHQWPLTSNLYLSGGITFPITSLNTPSGKSTGA